MSCVRPRRLRAQYSVQKIPLRKYASEFIGTFVLVLFACGTAAVTGCASAADAAYLLTALAFGLVIVAMAYSIGHVSGCHVDPAVSLGMLLSGRMTAKDFIGYVLSQFLGAIAGVAMRISAAAFAAGSEEEALKMAEVVTDVTHNHPEGVKGAKATALVIYLARTGHSKQDIKARVERDYYPLDFTIDQIRPDYLFYETCQETVPQAIQCFLESDSFEDTIRTAVSLGGDSDTLAAIAGPIAEAFRGIPRDLWQQALPFLDPTLRGLYDEWVAYRMKDKPAAAG